MTRFQSQMALYKSKFNKVDTFATLPVFDRVKKKNANKKRLCIKGDSYASPRRKFSKI